MMRTVSLSWLITIIFCLKVPAFLFGPSDVDFHPPSSTDINRCTTENQTFTCTVTNEDYNASDIIFYEHDDDIDSSLINIIDNKTAAYQVDNITFSMNEKMIGCYVTEKNLMSQNIMRVYGMPIPVQELTCVVLDYTGNVTCSWKFGTDYSTDSQSPKVTLYVGFDWTPIYKEWTYADLRDSVKFSAKTDTVLFNQIDILVGISVASKCGITKNRTFDGADVIKIQPYPVKDFQAEILNSTCVSLTWTHNRKQRIKQYQILYTSKWNQEQVEIYINESRSNKNIKEAVVCGLVPWTEYTFMIKVKPLDEPGVWSQQQEVIQTTPEDVPASSPVVVEGSYSWKRDECLQSNSIRSVVIFMKIKILDWSKSNDVADEICKSIPKIHEHGSNILTLINVTSHVDRQTSTQTTSGTFYQLQLHCNKAYDVTLQALNSRGLSANASFLRIAAAGEDFQKQLLVERNKIYDGIVHFEWNFNDENRDGIPTLFYTTNCKGLFIGDLEWKEFDVGVTTGSLVLPPNKDPEHFCYGLAVTTSKGNTGFEWNSCQYIKDIAPSTSPADLRVVAGNQDDTLLVTWSKWLCPEGEPFISHFQISYCIRVQGQNCTAPSIAVFSRDLTFATISDLDWEKEYAVQVRAVTRTNITGPWSEPVIGKPVNNSLKSGQIAGIAIGGLFVLAIVIAAVILFCRKFRLTVKKTLQGEPIETPKILPGPEVYTILDQNQNTNQNMINYNRQEFDRLPLYVNLTQRQSSIDSGVPEDPMTPPPIINSMEMIDEDERGETNRGYVESPDHSPRNQSPVNDGNINSYVTAEGLTATRSEDAARITESDNNTDQSEERPDDAVQPSSQEKNTRLNETRPINPGASMKRETQNVTKTVEPFAPTHSNICSQQERLEKEISTLVTQIPVPVSHIQEDIGQTARQNIAADLSKSSQNRNEIGMRDESSNNDFPDDDSSISHISGLQVISSYTQGYLDGIPNLGVDDHPKDDAQVSHKQSSASTPGTGTSVSHRDRIEQTDYGGIAFTDTKTDNDSHTGRSYTSNYVQHIDAMTAPVNDSHSDSPNAQNTNYVSQVDPVIFTNGSQSTHNASTGYVSNIDTLNTNSNTSQINAMNSLDEDSDTDEGIMPGYVFQMDDVNTHSSVPHQGEITYNSSSPELPNTFGYVTHTNFTKASAIHHVDNRNTTVSAPVEATAGIVPDNIGASILNVATNSSVDYVSHTDMMNLPTYLSHNTSPNYTLPPNDVIQTESASHKPHAQLGFTSSPNYGKTMTESVDYVPHDVIESLSKSVSMESSNSDLVHTDEAVMSGDGCTLDLSNSDYVKSSDYENMNNDQSYQVNNYVPHEDIVNPAFNKNTPDISHSIYNPQISTLSKSRKPYFTDDISHPDIQTLPATNTDPSCSLQGTNTAPDLASPNGNNYIPHSDIQTVPVNNADPSNNLQETNIQLSTSNGNKSNGNNYIPHTDIQTAQVDDADLSNYLQVMNTIQTLTLNGNKSNGNKFITHADIQTAPVNDTDLSNNLQATNVIQPSTSNGNKSNSNNCISHIDIQAAPVSDADPSNNLPSINTTQAGVNTNNDKDDGYSSHTGMFILPGNQSKKSQDYQTSLMASAFNGNPGYVAISDMENISSKLAHSEGSLVSSLEGQALHDSLDTLSDFTRSDTSSSYSNPSRNRMDSRSDDFLSSDRSDYSSMNESNEDRNESYNQSELYDRSENSFSNDLITDKYKIKDGHFESENLKPVKHKSSSSGSLERESWRNSGSDSEKDTYCMVGEGGYLIPALNKKQSHIQSKTHESKTELKFYAKTEQKLEHLASMEQNEVS